MHHELLYAGHTLVATFHVLSWPGEWLQNALHPSRPWEAVVTAWLGDTIAWSVIVLEVLKRLRTGVAIFVEDTVAPWLCRSGDLDRVRIIVQTLWTATSAMYAIPLFGSSRPTRSLPLGHKDRRPTGYNKGLIRKPVAFLIVAGAVAAQWAWAFARSSFSWFGALLWLAAYCAVEEPSRYTWRHRWSWLRSHVEHHSPSTYVAVAAIASLILATMWGPRLRARQAWRIAHIQSGYQAYFDFTLVLAPAQVPLTKAIQGYEEAAREAIREDLYKSPHLALLLDERGRLMESVPNLQRSRYWTMRRECRTMREGFSKDITACKKHLDHANEVLTKAWSEGKRLQLYRAVPPRHRRFLLNRVYGPGTVLEDLAIEGLESSLDDFRRLRDGHQLGAGDPAFFQGSVDVYFRGVRSELVRAVWMETTIREFVLGLERTLQPHWLGRLIDSQGAKG